MGSIENPYPPPGSPIINTPQQSGTLVTRDDPPQACHCPPSPQSTLQFTLGVTHSGGLDGCAVTRVHHYGTVWSRYTALKTLRAPPVHPSLTPTPGTHRFFFRVKASLRLSGAGPTPRSLPRLHSIASFWDVTHSGSRGVPTSGRLPSIRDVHLSFLRVFSWPDSSFLFSAAYDPPILDGLRFIHTWGDTLVAFLVQLKCRWLFPSVRPWRDDFASGVLGHSANVHGGDKGMGQK